MATKLATYPDNASIEECLSSLSSDGCSGETLRAYKTDLHGWSSWISRSTGPLFPIQPDWQEVESLGGQYLNAIRSTLAPATVGRKLTSMRTWARTNGNDNFLKRYRAPKIADRQPHPLPEGTVGILRMLYTTTDDQHRALVALCGLCGLRVSEACAIRPIDIDWTTMQIRVRGKGDKERLVPLGPTASTFIQPAVDQCYHAGDTLVRFNHDWARKVIRNLGIKAGLSRQISSHDLRSTFATDLLKNGTNVVVIQRILGHSSIETTMVYMATTEDDMRRAVL